MASLDPALRGALEKAVVEARTKVEDGARAALAVLGVDDSRAPATLSAEQRALRNLLRAKARQLGSDNQSTGFASVVEEVAYVHWHRMLFARFLAENNLLMHPEFGVSVTLEECEELALVEGDRDKWETAARYAGNMLPGIFSADDPSVQLRFAPESRAALEAILGNLPSQVFTAEDGLGWVYQFWQSKRKDEVSGSGLKIEKLDLAAYSQLFTEDYMVRFLLENSLGAWWASHHPDSELVESFEFLRFGDDGTPAAGSFSGWPKLAADITVMDPCCGSGHFLVVAFEMVRRMRMEEEGLDGRQAAEAVLRENLFGLELDPRCVQIAAFALALTAWKVGGYRVLPPLNVACSGIPVGEHLETWTKLALSDDNMKRTLERLHDLFAHAPDLGSLINPADVPVSERMFAPEFAMVEPLLRDALTRERVDDPVGTVFGNAALGVARAAELLGRQYTLVATNVPYLAVRKQGPVLREFVAKRHPNARADLATAFVERCRSFAGEGSAYALVTPQNWLFLGSYKSLREHLLEEQTLNHVSRLGDRAFETISGAVVNVALLCFTNNSPSKESVLSGLDATGVTSPKSKADLLQTGALQTIAQAEQRKNPDSRFSVNVASDHDLLNEWATGLAGIMNGDSPRFQRKFWEIASFGEEWAFQQTTVRETTDFGGRELVIRYDTTNGHLRESREVRRSKLHDSDRRGRRAWGKWGVAVSSMGTLTVSLYSGDLFDNNLAVILPKDPSHLPAIWAFCSSPEFNTAVRQIDSKVNVTNATLVKVPFDLQHWQTFAKEQWPVGLPEPQSDDPTQWLFRGDPVHSVKPLQVAVGRLLGYQWPQQHVDHLSSLAIPDGILPLVSIGGQEPAVERLRHVLAASHGDDWSSEQQTHLLRLVGFETKGLDAWLRDGFFEQHCRLFHQRPFIWNVWDGRKDGFAALVNYHQLDVANLDKLIYTYLGEWIRTQRAAEEAGTPGANDRLVAALELQQKLERIRDGEPPYDIYVRWKPLHEQPIGWAPDLDDGVRLNIRPFVEAGVLRSRVSVNWNNDRGRDHDGTERVNDVHLALSEKRAAREAKTE